jgi:hypothetical protein
MAPKRFPTASLLAGVAALALCLFPAPTALAQAGDEEPPPPARVVGQCLDRLSDIASTASGAIGGVARAGVDAIAALDANDAPPRALFRAGDRAENLIIATAQRAHAAVNAATRDCVRVLDRLGAPDAAFAAIGMGADAAHAVIRASAARGHLAVNAALVRALRDEGDPEGDPNASDPGVEPADVEGDALLTG